MMRLGYEGRTLRSSSLPCLSYMNCEIGGMAHSVDNGEGIRVILKLSVVLNTLYLYKYNTPLYLYLPL